MKLCSKLFLLFLMLYATLVIKAEAQDITNTELKKIEPQIVKFPDFIRFNFKSDEYVIFDPVISGNMLLIDFEKPNDLNLSNLVGKTSLLHSFGASPDNKSMIIRLNSTGAKLRKFIGDDFTTGIDIYFDEGAEEYKREVVMMSALPGGEEIKTTTDSVGTGTSTSNIITYPLDYIGPPRISQIYKIDDTFVGPLKENFYDVAIYEIMKVYDSNSTQVEISETDTGTLILFPFQDTEAIGSAAQVDDNVISVVFASKGTAVVPDVTNIAIIDNIEFIKNENFILVEITLNKEELSKAPRGIISYRNKYAWIVELESSEENKEFVVKPIKIDLSNEWGENNISISAKDIEGPFNVLNRQTNEVSKVFTIKNNGSGVLLNREFVDLKIDESIQGVFIHEKSDFIEYKLENGKVTISKLPNLIISDEIIATDFSVGSSDSNLISKTMGIFPEQSVFPFPKAMEQLDKMKNASDDSKAEETKENNKTENNNPEEEEGGTIDDTIVEDIAFSEKIIETYAKMVDTKDSEKLSDIKLELAEFYFSHSMYAESLGILYDIMINDPSYNNIFRVRSIYAGTLYLTKKYQQAYDSFSELVDESINNSSYNEFKLWKWFSLKKRNEELRIKGEPNIKIDFIASYDKFMQQYDDNLRFEFGLEYINELMNIGKNEDAKNILDIITYSAYPDKFKNDVKLLKAKFLLLNKNEEQALPLLDELINDVDDRKNRASALFELTKYNLINGAITADKAIEDFLLSSTIWRDDYFEMDVYETVGSLLLTRENYMEALKNWETLVTNFPQTAESIFILGKMKEVFIDLFDGGVAYEMEPMEALKIYFKYRELMPVGEIGDRITRKIAQFFIKSDMIEDAIDIVLHQIKYRSSGEEKARLVLWLSDIYQENRDLKSAEDVLNIINEEPNVSKQTQDLARYELSYIKAKMGLYNEGMELIKNDFSPKANESRIELFWVRENWFGIIKLVEQKLEELQETFPEPLTNKEMSFITKLAIAYSSQGMNEKLKELKDIFLSRITKDSDIRLFEYLSSGDLDVDYRDFNNTVQLEKLERFMNDYSFLPNKEWENIIEILEPKVELLLEKNPEELTRQNRFDIVRLALAYSQIRPEDLKLEQEMKKKFSNLSRDFKDVHIDRFSIDALALPLDDKFRPIDNDAIFEGKIKLADIKSFLRFYSVAKKMSELNQSIREEF